MADFCTVEQIRESIYRGKIRRICIPPRLYPEKCKKITERLKLLSAGISIRNITGSGQ